MKLSKHDNVFAFGEKSQDEIIKVINKIMDVIEESGINSYDAMNIPHFLQCQLEENASITMKNTPFKNQPADTPVFY